MNKHKSLLDSLRNKTDISDDTDIPPDILKELTQEILPEACLNCKNQIICNIFQSITNISTLGIFLDIKECPYYSELNNE